ncbi:MAG TPA: carbohydrate ABC transporter permease [Anaerolineae bacterium]|nr:carbohydrate ABC transporter permease [Anaerolineae bacterium]
MDISRVLPKAGQIRALSIGKKRSKQIGNIVVFIVLAWLGFGFSIPFIWMVGGSIKNIAGIYAYPPQLIPRTFEYLNFVEVFKRMPFNLFFRNSAYIAITVTIGVLATASMGGYAFARLRFPGRDKIFLLYLATMMVPGAVTMIPRFAMMNAFGWINTHIALIVPALCGPWSTFMMRQFMVTIPRELEDAAKIDGCGYFRTYFAILLPLCKPVLATLGMMTFMGQWNDFLWPLIVLTSMRKKTLALGLAAFQNFAAGKTPWHLIMAAATVSILPILVLFVLGQKYYVRGIVTTGLKGVS